MSNTYFTVCFPEVGWAPESVIDSISWRAKAAASRKKASTCTEKKGWGDGVFLFLLHRNANYHAFSPKECPP